MKSNELLPPFIGACLWWTTIAATGQSAVSIKVLEASLPESNVTARVTVLKDPPCLFDRTAYGWGVENTCSKESIGGIMVEQGGKRQIVPLSAFADLAEPRTIRLIGKTPRSFILQISGGDAATSYRANLRFENGALKTRRVESGEFPADANETTKYRFNIDQR
ncbi:hypothetical protein EZ313_02340 [Ramlibacter henchirensis]|uniref:Uncharacterized protein n=1 Tax=Ramlibacter henchirensis TaxID=204072 RepID=A0A4Z0C201_9BURK|nr:hypothetical protein [Ramlibacter henchirensis]TFZ05533.1 hypothetical protein EZ313_02340 [Ramlibacter henchirensis]